jgi:two-component system sensor histidine kinase UhpB
MPTFTTSPNDIEGAHSPPSVSTGNDASKTAIATVLELLVAAVPVNGAAFIESAASPEEPAPVIAGSMSEDDLGWLYSKGYLTRETDFTCIRFQTQPPRWAQFLVLPVQGRMGSVLVARCERAVTMPARKTRVAMLTRECLRRLLAAEHEADIMSTSLMVGEELFRTRLAAELHDDVGQRLSALLMESRRLQNGVGQPGQERLYGAAQWIYEQLRECNSVVRDLVYETSAPALTQLGLPAALRDLVERRQARSSLIISYSFDIANSEHDPSYDEVPHTVQVACLRIVQEAVTNVVKHASAKHCAITLTLSKSDLIATIEDDGVGLPDACASGGFGMIGMRERAAMLGGRVTVRRTNSGRGTVVSATLPFDPRFGS